MLSNNFFGLHQGIKYYPFQRIATGISWSWTAKKIDNTFSYYIGQPIIHYIEFGWINQYDFVQSDKIRISFNLNNGITISRLGDNNEQVKVETDRGYRYIAKGVATNYFYLLQPGLDISFRIFRKIHNQEHTYLTAKAKYNFVFGDSKYGQLSDFSNYFFALGFSSIYSCDPREHRAYEGR